MKNGWNNGITSRKKKKEIPDPFGSHFAHCLTINKQRKKNMCSQSIFPITDFDYDLFTNKRAQHK